MHYAFFHLYNLNMRTEDGERIGHLHVFSTRRDRDWWVAEELYEQGNQHREAISAREARRVLELFALCHNTTLRPSEVKYEPTSALVRFYRDYTRDNFICDESFAYVHD